MPVEVAEHGVAIEANHVYLLPPRKEMAIKSGQLRLIDKDMDNAVPQPIDRFFRSLATELGSDSVAVVLSGTGSDGSRGAREVKSAGGRVYAEDPEIAAFDGMPRSVIATGVVDMVGSPQDIAEMIVAGRDFVPRHFVPLSATDAVLDLVRQEFSIDFSLYKRGTVLRRIERRVDLLGFNNADEYLAFVIKDERERNLLYEDLLIGVTQFFRDPNAFAVIEQKVVPSILDRVTAGEEIRVWVAGCATGEEAYSLAMLFYEQLAKAERPINVKILATDVHRTSLARAGRGVYSEKQLQHVSPNRRKRFFIEFDDGYRVSRDLRELVVFAPHDVTKDAPFTRMHLISCRNMLIYLEASAQANVLSLFHFGLLPGAYLFLGSSEATASLSAEFSVEHERAKVYRKRRNAVLKPTMPFQRRVPLPRPHEKMLHPQGTNYQLLGVYDQLLERYMPPSLLVDQHHMLVDCFGGAEHILAISRRRPSMNVLDLLPSALRPVTSTAIQRALRSKEVVRYSGLTSDGGDLQTLIAEPFMVRRSNVDHVLLTFQPRQDAPPNPILVPPELGRPPAASVTRSEDVSRASRMSDLELDALEGELSHAREALQSTVEELQTSNEELQASNEELVASNEELQSTNEELHSVNEELYTVNAEHQKKNTELREANDDIQHLLEGTGIGTLFLDRRLRIRRYTPRISKVFRIRPQDVGRSIRDITHKLKQAELLEDIERVLRTGETKDAEVRDLDGMPYVMRLLPYRPQDAGRDADGSGAESDDSIDPEGAVDGVVMSLTEISALESMRTRLRGLSAIVESSDDAILGKDLKGIITSWNAGAERLYGYTAAEAVGQHIGLIAPPGYHGEMQSFIESVKEGKSLEHVETRRRRKDGQILDVSVTLSPIRGREGAVIGVSAIARDISALKRANTELERREQHIRLLLQSTAEAIFGVDLTGRCTFCNPACARLLGYLTTDELLDANIHDFLQIQVAEGDDNYSPIEVVMRTGQGTHTDAASIRRLDGTYFAAEYWNHPVRSLDGEVVGAVVTFLDVTERKAAEEEIRVAAQRREAFLAMLSHELRNPLGAVLAATRVMEAQAENPDVLAKARDVIQRQSSHMARLLDDLLDVARITRGGLELKKQDLDIRIACEAACETVGPALRAKHIDLRIDLADEPLFVRGDAARLQQVVGNLLSNAVRYSPDGSQVRLRAVRAGTQVQINVEDDGYGIAPDMLEEVFELFVQSDKSLARSDGGMGVGLTLVRRIVELHGGRVRAFSDGNQRGTRLEVWLPAQTTATLATEPPATSNGQTRRVVLVEDQEDARIMLRLLLEARGHNVREAEDGEQGVSLISEEPPDVAFVDIGLHG